MAEIKIEKIENTRHKAHIKTTAEEAKAAEQKSLATIKSGKQIPGFRKGKAPDHIIRARFAAELAGESLNNVVRQQIEAINKQSEHGVYEIVNLENLDQANGTYTFDLFYDSYPYVVLGKLKDASLADNQVVVETADIEKELKETLKMYATAKPREEGASAVAGDLLSVEYEIWSNDTPLGEAVKGRTLVLGENRFNPEIEKQMIEKGAKVGEEFTTSSENKSQNPDGSESTTVVKIIVTVEKLSQVEYPELNEEFLQKHYPEFKTTDELKKNIEEKLVKHYERTSMEKEVDSAIDKLVELSEIYFPEKYIDEKAGEYLAERKVTMDVLSDTEKDEIRKSMQKLHQRRLMVQHLLAKATEKIENFNHRDNFLKFSREEFGAETAIVIENIYNAMQSGRQLDNESSNMLDRLLKLFHWKLIYGFFNDNSMVKKGNKVKYSEYFSEQAQ